MRRECRERFPHHRLQRKPLVSDPRMHHGTCVTHVRWCMSGSLTLGGGAKRSRHPRRMRNPQFYVFGKRPMVVVSMPCSWWLKEPWFSLHYSDIIMSAMASQTTGASTVCSTVCSPATQRKHQSSGLCEGNPPVDSPYKGPVARKMFPSDDVIRNIPVSTPGGIIIFKVFDYKCV